MKKLILFSCLLLIMISTSGCVKYEYTIDIDKKNNIAFSQVTACNTEVIKELSKEVTIQGCSYDELKAIVDENSFINKYNKDGFDGIKADKKYDIKSFKLPSGFTSNTEKPFEIKSAMGGAKKTYSINWQYNIKNTEKANTDKLYGQDTNSYETGYDSENDKYNKQSMEYASQQMSNMFAKMIDTNPKLKPNADLIIKIPAKKANKHNATKVVNKNEYHWNLINNYEEPVSIELEYSMYDFSLFGILGTMIFLLIGLAYAWIKINE